MAQAVCDLVSLWRNSWSRIIDASNWGEVLRRYLLFSRSGFPITDVAIEHEDYHRMDDHVIAIKVRRI